MLPLAWCWPQFREMYWFHDDWNLMNDWASAGAEWVWQPMGEHLSLLFKLLWMGAVTGFGGSYTAMILLLWATHLAVLILFGLTLARCGFSSGVAALAVVTLGLPWTNIETLGWAVCWSSLLCSLFLVCGFVAFSYYAKGVRWASVAGFLAALASALTFSRGALSGLVLAVFVFPFSRRWSAGLIGLSLVLVGIYQRSLSGYGNFQSLGAKLGSMALWSVKYELLNPLYHFVSLPGVGIAVPALLLFGGLKIAVMIAGIRVANPQQRTFLWALILLDLGIAALTAVGRYPTGDIGVISYRYQYVSLMCFGPFLGLVLVRTRFLWVFMVVWVALVGSPWKRHAGTWGYQRGVEVRQALAATPDDQTFGLALITAGRARELIARYGLH
jgi:hypothetical protein